MASSSSLNGRRRPLSSKSNGSKNESTSSTHMTSLYRTSCHFTSCQFAAMTKTEKISRKKKKKMHLVPLVVLASMACCPALGFVAPSSSSSRPRLHQFAPRRSSLFLAATKPPNNGDNDFDFPIEEEVLYSGDTDWDAEWKKVMANQKVATTTGKEERPGKNYYKSEAEIAAIRAANKATEKFRYVSKQTQASLSWDRLKGDWKFWIGVLAVLSFGTALLSALATTSLESPSSISSPDSYYI